MSNHDALRVCSDHFHRRSAVWDLVDFNTRETESRVRTRGQAGERERDAPITVELEPRGFALLNPYFTTQRLRSPSARLTERGEFLGRLLSAC